LFTIGKDLKQINNYYFIKTFSKFFIEIEGSYDVAFIFSCSSALPNPSWVQVLLLSQSTSVAWTMVRFGGVHLENIIEVKLLFFLCNYGVLTMSVINQMFVQ